MPNVFLDDLHELSHSINDKHGESTGYVIIIPTVCVCVSLAPIFISVSASSE